MHGISSTANVGTSSTILKYSMSIFTYLKQLYLVDPWKRRTQHTYISSDPVGCTVTPFSAKAINFPSVSGSHSKAWPPMDNCVRIDRNSVGTATYVLTQNVSFVE